MYSILAAGFLIMTIGMTGVLLFLGWQQHQIDRSEREAEIDRRKSVVPAKAVVVPSPSA